ncbi:hypothetical protein TRFO_18216 [Tritrichomonas foetus]|uniref:Uncharacterized protein n=1 Tax=Tritrichomonas foetus TaxID=1144522 RepID=A0A1J4KL51_9EUKA|nr:hypothetical protein TRFO_18216 [Tritrichomonas foetus]|eukprot:OHT12031.1 hypothetical protein TRFO_18216 [Tritrichomonas foetus]
MPPRPVPLPNQPGQIAQGSQSVSSTVVTTATTTQTKSSKSRSQSQTTNIELEFTQRFLSLFTSFYENPSIEEIVTFPQNLQLQPSDQQKAPGRTPPFHSGVWDLRLRKALDARVTNDQLASDSLSEQVLQLRESLASETPDLNDVFVPPMTERPQIPLYLQNIQKDEDQVKDSRRPRIRSTSINFAETSQMFSERLKRQKEKSQERRRNRFIQAKELEDQHMNFVKTLHHTKIQENNDLRTTAKAKFRVLQEQRERQAREGRRNNDLIRNKSPIRGSESNRY